MAVWKKRDTHLTEDFPSEIQAHWRQLAPFLALTKDLDIVKQSEMVEDILVRDGRSYNVKNLHTVLK